MSVSTDTEYGHSPGVRAIVGPGGVASTQIGRAQKLVVFARGDPSAGSANTNTPRRIQTVSDPAELFGQDSQLAEGLQKALRNKGNREWMYGVMPQENSVQGEPITDGNSLENAPIIEDPSLVTVRDITDSTSPVTQTVEFRYGDPPSAPSGGETVAIKPQTGEFVSGDDASYEIDYSFLDWDAALDAADQVLNHSEVGIYCVDSTSENVAELLEAKLTPSGDETGLRREYKLASGVIGAQPNLTTEEGEPGIDAEQYSDAIDSKAVFMPAGVTRTGTAGRTILAGIAGTMAGNELQNPVYGDEIRGYGRLTQAFNHTEANTLRDNQLMPVVDDYRDADDRGITVEGNLSTSSQTEDFRWSFQARRVIDLIILAQHEIGRGARDNLITEDLMSEIETNVRNVFDNFASANLIRGNPDGNTTGSGASGGTIGSLGTTSEDNEDVQYYFVEATRTDTGKISVSSGFSPTPVLTDIVMDIRVTDTLDQAGAGGETTTQTE